MPKASNALGTGLAAHVDAGGFGRRTALIGCLDNGLSGNFGLMCSMIWFVG